MLNLADTGHFKERHTGIAAFGKIHVEINAPVVEIFFVLQHLLNVHDFAFVGDNRMVQRAALDIEAEIVMFRGVSSHDFHKAVFSPRFPFAIYEHLTFGKVVGKHIKHIAVGPFLQGRHQLENALAHHDNKMLLIVGDVSGHLVCTKSCFEFCSPRRFQALLVIFGVRHLFPFAPAASRRFW